METTEPEVRMPDGIDELWKCLLQHFRASKAKCRAVASCDYVSGMEDEILQKLNAEYHTAGTGLFLVGAKHDLLGANSEHLPQYYVLLSRVREPALADIDTAIKEYEIGRACDENGVYEALYEAQNAMMDELLADPSEATD